MWLGVTLRGKKLLKQEWVEAQARKEEKGGSAHLVMQIIHGLIRGDAEREWRGRSTVLSSLVLLEVVNVGVGAGVGQWRLGNLLEGDTRVASRKKRNYL